jgi:hypothetical protein
MELVITAENVILKGKTFDHREKIKALGGRWDPERKSWKVPLDQKEAAEQLALTTKYGAPKRTTKKHCCCLCGVEGHKRGTCPLPDVVQKRVQADVKWKRFILVNGRYEGQQKEKQADNPYYLTTAYRLCYCTDYRICLACQYGCCEKVYVSAGSYGELHLNCPDHGAIRPLLAVSSQFELMHLKCEKVARKENLRRLNYAGD